MNYLLFLKEALSDLCFFQKSITNILSFVVDTVIAFFHQTVSKVHSRRLLCFKYKKSQ